MPEPGPASQYQTHPENRQITFTCQSYRVATYHPPQNSLTFPHFSITFCGFPYPLTYKKKSFLFFSLMVLTVSLQNLGVNLNGKNLLP